MKPKPQPKLVFQPETYQGFQQGINLLADAIAPTLGPFPRHVAIDSKATNKAPELLDNGAIIARRMIQLEDRNADMGAMYLRQLLWKIHETIGDGTATATVLFRAMYNEAVRFITSGGNAMLLRQELDALILTLEYHLDRMSRPVTGKDQLAKIAEHICNDHELATHLAALFDTIGEYGALDIQSSQTLEDQTHLIQGAHWKSKPLVDDLLPAHSQREQILIKPHIVLSDLELNEPQAIIRIIQTAIQAEADTLLIFAFSVSPQVANVLRVNNQKDRIKMMVMQVPGITTEERFHALRNISLLTGAKPLLSITNDTVDQLTPAHLGCARNVWCSNQYVGIAGGGGNRAALHQQIQQLKAQCANTKDAEMRQKLYIRLGVLLGGASILRVGGIHEIEVKRRKALAKRTAQTLRGLLNDGVVFGGGIAYLKLAQELQHTQSNDTWPSERRAAQSIIINALSAPMRTLAENAGYEAGHIIAQLDPNGAYHVFDARDGTIQDARQIGLFDSAATLRYILRATIQSVALALSIDVLFQHKNPTVSDTP